MALSYVALGTVATTIEEVSMAPAPPAHNAADLLVMIVGIHTSGTKTIDVPAGWTAVSNGATFGGGVTVFGIDTGKTRTQMLYRVAPDTATTAVTVTTPGVEVQSVQWAAIMAFRATSGVYSVAGCSGIETVGDATWTAVMDVNPGMVGGDMVAIGSSLPTDAITAFASTTLTATGLTATVTDRTITGGSNGNDWKGLVSTATVDAGPATGVATYSTTLTGTATNAVGSTIVTRIREVVASTSAAVPSISSVPSIPSLQ